MSLINDHCMLRPFMARFFLCMFIFYKTEVQTVISRCLTSLNLTLFKSCDKRHQNTKNANVCFCTKVQITDYIWQKMVRNGCKMIFISKQSLGNKIVQFRVSCMISSWHSSHEPMLQGLLKLFSSFPNSTSLVPQISF